MGKHRILRDFILINKVLGKSELASAMTFQNMHSFHLEGDGSKSVGVGRLMPSHLDQTRPDAVSVAQIVREISSHTDS